MDAPAGKALKVSFTHQGRPLEATVQFFAGTATFVFSSLPHYRFTIDLEYPDEFILALPSDRKDANPVICGSLGNAPFLAEALNAVQTALWLAPKAPNV